MLIREGKLKVEKDGKKYIFHDPCYLGRHNRIYEEPRFILKSLGDTVEAERSRGNSFCCGAGGGRMWLEEKIGKKINLERTEELLSKEPDEIVVGCPFCLVMITDGVKAKGLPPYKVKDISEVISENLKG
jgi:Fe-S oxidoreductase